MYRISKQILAIGLPIATVAATGAAVAYWTGGAGEGSGDAGTATPAATALTVAQLSAPSNMAPGITTGPITVRVTNPSTSTTNVYSSKVVVSIASVTPMTGAPSGPGFPVCDENDYALADAEMTIGAKDLAPGAFTTFSGASLVFANSETENQDACKGATVTLAYAAS